jgi:hypothetical protein
LHSLETLAVLVLTDNVVLCITHSMSCEPLSPVRLRRRLFLERMLNKQLAAFELSGAV